MDLKDYNCQVAFLLHSIPFMFQENQETRFLKPCHKINLLMLVRIIWELRYLKIVIFMNIYQYFSVFKNNLSIKIEIILLQSLL